MKTALLAIALAGAGHAANPRLRARQDVISSSLWLNTSSAVTSTSLDFSSVSTILSETLSTTIVSQSDVDTVSTIVSETISSDISIPISTAPGDTTSPPITSDPTSDPTPVTEPFPTYIPPTTAIPEAEETEAANDVGPLLFYLWTNRDWLEDDDHRDEYIRGVLETEDAVLALFNNLRNQPPPHPRCSQTSLRKRSLITDILGELSSIADLVSCAVQVVGNLAQVVVQPVPPIQVIVTLTDTLHDIENELEQRDEQQSDTPSSQQPTSTTSCASAVPSCTETISLSTSLLIVGTDTSSVVETITTTDCVTITACEATTITTTVATTTSSEVPVCDFGCNENACGVAATASPDVVRRWAEVSKRELQDADTIDNPGLYVRDTSSNLQEQLDWGYLNSDAVSADYTFGEDVLRRSIVGLAGCTGVVIASRRGFWYTHLMEPGFRLRSDDDIDRWNNRVVGPLRDGYNGPVTPGFNGPMTAPSTLAGEGGILENTPDNDVRIYISTVSTGEQYDDDFEVLPRVPKYSDRVQEILNLLQVDGPFANVPVTQKFYDWPSDSGTEAIGRLLVEYDPAGLASDPSQRAYRVWLEEEPHVYQWASCSGNSAGNQKRDGACTLTSNPTSTAETEASQTEPTSAISTTDIISVISTTEAAEITSPTAPVTSAPTETPTSSFCVSSTESLYNCRFVDDMGICDTTTVCIGYGITTPPPTTTAPQTAGCISSTESLYNCRFVEGDIGICDTTTVCELWDIITPTAV
ncbi:hypothetical protein B0I35DRAFT_439377 [Stachybotrys elegans]|uniref:Ig-like domain-containing protein n=1 Tax=Stachybotrys elegans TaxID=80388 RepID=A0A8K0WMA1_9HYPO|nr:hypothetical protein B0I35DRAFT_439377 [Stachybotrys elegans]